MASRRTILPPGEPHLWVESGEAHRDAEGGRMARMLPSLCLLLVMFGAGSTAQDAKAVLQTVARVIGAEGLRCVAYSGSGYVGIVGQNYTPRDDWPRVELASYTKTIDFTSRSAREEQVRRQGSFPARGGGTPVIGEVRQVNFVSGDHAWTLQATNAVPQPAAAAVRQLDLWLTPHGFVKAAMAAASPVLLTRNEGGEAGVAKRRVTVISITALGKYRVNATINAENLIERVQTWMPNPVIGDMYYETVYSAYKDFGTLRFPTRFHHHDDWDDTSSGNPVVRGGHHGFDLTVTAVTPNACGEPIATPEAVQEATIPEVRVVAEKLGDGIYLLGGGSHHSVAVEFRDFVAVVEAPLNEERSLAVIAEVRRLFPGKTIDYVVNTHHHFDHAGGLRTYVHDEGSTIITYRGNRDFYGQEVFSLKAQRTLQPDRLSLYPPEEAAEGYRFETVVERYTLSDGSRTMDVHHVQGLSHVEGMLMAYLPKEKILIEADMYSPPAQGAPPAPPTAAAKTLLNNVRRLKLDVSTIAPIHGRVIPWSDFLKMMGTP
jgi:glyoxylase-like metal-dependent hydrolase (beta-lactamase superfamily II)